MINILNKQNSILLVSALGMLLTGCRCTSEKLETYKKSSEIPPAVVKSVEKWKSLLIRIIKRPK
ncbi:hypothetical protein BCR32DRAFT_325652 [Anaeromyces robustus]|uniref:Lipoprotein n=1 Tax=Anaeromyces robustus TaxID=1754192 RepID=A0A1Y1XI18_9FUNG|nr:hypothetical protein BCR32DRAFT_325652 [Anaeromyces robustus]|eukprot:ORX85014.1 hypothetical protein BCR32DRAFT_325652 [Anaeromyces robustus]